MLGAKAYKYITMKNFTEKIVITALVLTGCAFSFSQTVFAQWDSQDPSTYNYDYSSYTNPNIDVVQTTCVGCTNGTTQ